MGPLHVASLQGRLRHLAEQPVVSQMHNKNSQVHRKYLVLKFYKRNDILSSSRSREARQSAILDASRYYSIGGHRDPVQDTMLKWARYLYHTMR